MLEERSAHSSFLMAVEYKDGMHTRWFCNRCGCRTDGTLKMFGVKWVNYRKCGHETFAGYIQPPEILRAKGILKSVSEMEPDPRIEADKRGEDADKFIEFQERVEFQKRREVLTRGRFL